MIADHRDQGLPEWPEGYAITVADSIFPQEKAYAVTHDPEEASEIFEYACAFSKWTPGLIRVRINPDHRSQR